MTNLAYQDDMPTEMLNGKTIAMSPRPVVNHNIVSGNIYGIFRNFLRGKNCTAFNDSVDVHLTERARVIPDVMIVCNKDIVKKRAYMVRQI